MKLRSAKAFLLTFTILILYQSALGARKYYIGVKYPQFSFNINSASVSSGSVLPSNPSKDVDRIAGGYYATEKQFPFMAIVHRLLTGSGTSQCGGTIISKRWVLTAGHCIAQLPHKFLVVFGIISKSGISYDKHNGPGVSMLTNRLVVHPKYFHSTNDIGFLYMPQDIPYTREIQPIPLAGHSEVSTTFSDNSAYVIGWGRDKQTGSGTMALKYAILPIISHSECLKFWQVDERNICTAPGLGQNACQGDSGGPLVVVKDNRYLQVGIVSYGDGDCPSSRPGVFTKITAFLPWMEKVTGLRF